MRSHLRTAIPLCLSAMGVLACTSADPSAPAAAPAPGPPVVTRRPAEPVGAQLIGSGGFGYAYGSAFVGATAPAGLVKAGPDTKGPWGTSSFLHFSGYWYGDDTIQGFSHMHLHGTGATDYGVLALMPSDGFDASRTTSEGYESKFQKATEEASPGRYSVTLDRGNIEVDLVATPHAAYHRYTFPAGAPAAHVILDLDHHLSGGVVDSAEVTIDKEARVLRGRLHSTGAMSGGFGGYEVFFEARMKTAWADSLVWQNGEAPAEGAEASGTGVGVDLAFDLASSAGPVEIAMGLSLVSAAGAAANLDAEIPDLDFDAAAASASGAWDELLGRVRVTGGQADDQTKMAAAVYHLFMMPSAQSDADGSYTAMDGVVRKAEGFRYLSDMSLWDTYRTLHPLYDLIAPELARDSVVSLHEKAKAGGFFPKWPLATGEAGTMLGSSAEVVLADAFVKGITDFDAEGAYQLMRAAAMDASAPPGGRGGRDDVEPYMALGYVPSSRGRSVSVTTEYANDDFGLAALAEGLGHMEDAAALRARATGYRALYDAETGFLWAKDESGAFSTPHTDPARFSDEYAEANAWQSLWMVAEDIEGLAEVAGGREVLIAKLEELFEKGKEDYEALDYSSPLTSGGVRPYYWGANEPDMNAAYVFAQLGRPDLTQKWVAWSRAFLYGPGADGLPGNDDGGTMSAWLVFSALGFYPIPATDRYIVGAPLFPHAEIAASGGTFTVDAPGVSDTNVYVQSVKLNGAALEVPEIRHADLSAGGTLELVMGPSPSSWGRAKGD